MPIAMERFEAEGSFLRMPADICTSPVFPFHRECHYCGYEVSMLTVRPKRCPRCGGSAWEQYPRRRTLLAAASRLTPVTEEIEAAS